MNVLFVSNDPAIFNAKSEARARMRTYAAAIGELHIVSPAPFGAREEQEENLYLHPVRAWRLFRIGALTRAARSLIAKYGIEVVSAQDPFEQGLAASNAVLGTSAKLHVQVHTDFLSPWFVRTGNWRSPQVRMPFLNRYRRSLADQVLPQAAGIRVVSERIKHSLTARYGSHIKEPSVIPVPVDATVPTPIPLPAHPTFTFPLIAVGRLEPEKRLQDVLAAVKLVNAHYPIAGLIVVGEGRERSRLERMAKSLGIADKVLFLGARADARALLRSASAFIQASAYEGYGRTLIEAALVGVPVITTDVGIVGEVFKGYEDVIAVPVADPTALSLAIVGLIEDTQVRLELPRHAAETAKRHLAAVGDVPARLAADLARLVP